MCCKKPNNAGYGFGYYGNNAAAPAVKVVRLKDLREKVNEKLFEMEIENFFPGDKGFCGEKEDMPLKPAGGKAIEEIYRKLCVLQEKRYDEKTEKISFNEESKTEDEKMDTNRKFLSKL